MPTRTWRTWDPLASPSRLQSIIDQRTHHLVDPWPLDPLNPSPLDPLLTWTLVPMLTISRDARHYNFFFCHFGGKKGGGHIFRRRTPFFIKKTMKNYLKIKMFVIAHRSKGFPQERKFKVRDAETQIKTKPGYFRDGRFYRKKWSNRWFFRAKRVKERNSQTEKWKRNGTKKNWEIGMPNVTYYHII